MQYREVFQADEQTEQGRKKLRKNRSPGSTGNTHMEWYNKQDIQKDIQNCRKTKEHERCPTIAYRTQNAGQIIVQQCKWYSDKNDDRKLQEIILRHLTVSLEGAVYPAFQIVVLILLVAAPAFIHFTEPEGGPGAKHAAILISLAAGVIVGILAQRTRLCMVGGIRDAVLFGEYKLLFGFVAILVSALIMNVALGFFHPGFVGQPIAHTDGLWNALGMYLAGFGCILLGGCPMRQLILSGEGNTDSVVTVLGLMAGAAFAHNFGLASSADGPTANGKIAVVIGIVVVAAIAVINSMRKEEA